MVVAAEIVTLSGTTHLRFDHTMYWILARTDRAGTEAPCHGYSIRAHSRWKRVGRNCRIAGCRSAISAFRIGEHDHMEQRDMGTDMAFLRLRAQCSDLRAGQCREFYYCAYLYGSTV